jgi:hypothetical protein
MHYLKNIITIRINNNSKINNNYERLQDLILLFKIPMGTQKDLFEVYGQFGYARLRSFASPALEV